MPAIDAHQRNRLDKIARLLERFAHGCRDDRFVAFEVPCRLIEPASVARFFFHAQEGSVLHDDRRDGDCGAVVQFVIHHRFACTNKKGRSGLAPAFVTTDPPYFFGASLLMSSFFGAAAVAGAALDAELFIAASLFIVPSLFIAVSLFAVLPLLAALSLLMSPCAVVFDFDFVDEDFLVEDFLVESFLVVSVLASSFIADDEVAAEPAAGAGVAV